MEQSHTLEQTFDTLRHAFSEVYGFVASLLLSTDGLPAGHYRVLRAPLEDDSEGLRQTHADPHLVYSGGTMGSVINRQQPELIQEVDWSLDPLFGQTLRGYSSVIAVPLAGKHVPASWVIILKQAPNRFAESDLEEAVERASLVSAVLENQLLAAELAAAHERIDRDARRAGELQRALLPASLPRVAGLEIAASYEPCDRAGGDLYDFFPLDGAQDDVGPTDAPGCWCALVGDASGHGLAAALVMGIVQAVLHAHPPGTNGPATLLMHANRQLCEKRIGGFFTTFLAVYEPVSRRLCYANAGHPPPLLRRSRDGSIQLLDAAVNYPLGIDENESFNEAAVQLEGDDLVLLYTDGITESRDGRDDFFGQERLTSILRASCGRPVDRPVELIECLRAAVCAHENGQPALDDQTLVAARVL